MARHENHAGCGRLNYGSYGAYAGEQAYERIDMKPAAGPGVR